MARKYHAKKMIITIKSAFVYLMILRIGADEVTEDNILAEDAQIKHLDDSLKRTNRQVT